MAEDPSKLNDLQIAHVAYTADNIDIRYAHLALALTSNPKSGFRRIHDPATTPQLIRQHWICSKTGRPG